MGGLINTSYFGKDLNYIISDLWVAVTGLATNTISASQTDLTNGADLDTGGEVLRSVKSLVVCASAISAPSIGQLCSVSGTEFMITQITLAQDGICYTLDLADPTT